MFCIAASWAGVGSTSPSPSAWTRTVVAPTKLAMLGAMPRFSSLAKYWPSVRQSIVIFDVALPLGFEPAMVSV